MMFCTVDDVKRMVRDRAGQEMIDIGNDSDADISISDVERFIEAEAEYIVTRLARTPSQSALVRDINASLAAYTIWIHVIIGGRGGDIPEFVEAWKTQAEERLDEMYFAGDLQSRTAPGGTLSMRSSNIKEMRWEEINLHDTDFYRLVNDNIVPASLKVFQATDQLIMYHEKVDYELNARTGEIRRLSSGNITDGQLVYVSYNYVALNKLQARERSINWRGSANYWDNNA